MARSKLLIAKEQEDENGYWTGDDGASGILPIARDTGRICLAWRNKETHTGDCWGTIGGAIKDGLTPEDSAVSEMKEETGYTGEIEMHPAWVFEDGDFSYYNFVGIVDSEFKLKAQKAHAWETDEIVWLTLAEILEDMEEVPEEYHPEFINLFKESAELIERFAGTGVEKTADVQFPQWIGVDLDGTIAEAIPGNDYSDPTLIGPPIPAMIEKILDALEAGETVKVFTARMADKENADRIAQAIGDYTEEHIGERLDATNEKDPGMKEIWDDKARGVIEGTGEFKTAAVDVQLENDCYDSHGGETFCTLRAKSSGNTIGFIDYSLYDGSVHLKMIEVAPEWQRQGVGTQLVEGLRKENPGMPIEWGGTTPEGAALKTKVHQPSDEPPNRLLQELEENRDKFAAEAQDIYNTWPVPMFDNSPGEGGLAENIAEAFEWAVGHYTSGYGVVKPEGDDYVVLCTERNHTAKLYLPSSLFQVKAGDEWERKDGVSVTPEDIQIMSSTPKAAGLPKNPPGKPETVYPEESNGWALFPDQRGENEAPTLDKMIPEVFK